MPTDSRTDRLAFAGVAALTVLTWYALPDAVRGRTLRGVIKTALLGVTAAGVAVTPEVFPEVRRLTPTPTVDLPAPVAATLVAGAAALTLGATVWGEKVIYARGERARARGVRCAHTRTAVLLALATAAPALVDWTRVAQRWAPDDPAT